MTRKRKKTKKQGQEESAKEDKISLAMKSKEEIQYVQRRVSIIYSEKQRNSKETDLSQETQKERVCAKHNRRRRKRRDRGNKEDRLESSKLQNQKQQDQTRKRTRK